LCNCRSLLPKYDELCIFNSTSKCDLIFLTETWLHVNIDDSIINIKNYNLLRNDRDNKRGGGVCIYIHNKHQYKLLEDRCKPKEIEAIWIAVKCIIYCLIYIPPSEQFRLADDINNYLIDNFDTFAMNYPSYNYTILGDFNCFKTDYISSQLSLTMIVDDATRGISLLDKIFISGLTDNINVQVLDPLSTSDHNKILVTYTHEKVNYAHNYKVSYDFRESNLANFMSLIKNSNFLPLLFENNIDKKLDIFYSIVQKCLLHIPQKRIPFSSRDKPWITPVLKNLITNRWNAFREKNFTKYDYLKEKVKKEIQKCKSLYYSNLVNKRKKSVWHVLKEERTKSSIRFTFDGSDKDLAEEINKNLHEILSDPLKSYEIPHKQVEPENITFSVEEVATIVKNINSKKASSDILPSKILILLSECCPQYVTHIFNTIMHNCTWPSNWKKATIIPLPKDRVPNYKNVRPISILSPLNKCLEKLFKSRILPHYIKSIDKCQYGFIPLGSTSSAIIALLNRVLLLLDSPKVIAVSIMSFDFKKAFDKVNHQLLLNKLSNFLPHNFICILASYLKGRQQKVQINTSYSNNCDIDCGVPQGSVLSPILFGLFICDLIDSPTSFCFKYADDSTFVVPHYTSETSHEIKDTFDHVENWCKLNKLQLNIKKTQLLTIKKGSISYKTVNNIRPVEEIKLLGITIQNTLKWNSHVITTIKSASQSLYLIRKCRNILNHSQLVILYNSFILSKVCYAAPAWAYLPHYLKQCLIKIYKRCHRIICGNECKENCLKNPIEHCEKMAFKHFLNITRHPNHPLRNLLPDTLPTSKRLLLPIMKTERYRNSFIPKMTLLYNSLF